MRAPLKIPPLTAGELEALENLYRTTKDPRMRTRAQIILLAGEQRLRVSAIAPIVREVTQTVRNWLKHWMAEGIEGLKDRPMPGPPPKITEASKEQLLAAVRRRPRSLEQPYSMWTLQRLADSMAEQTGIRASIENVRLVLKAGEIVLSRPQHKVSSPDPEYLVKKDDRRRARRAKRGRRVLLCRRVQSQLVSHVARDVEPKRPASDDPHAQAAR